MANIYIESGLEASLESTRKASAWITEHLAELKQELNESEVALQVFLDQENLVDAQGVDSLAVMQLDEITANLVDARHERSQAEELYRQVNALKDQPIEANESIPAVLKDPILHQAKNAQAEAQRKVSELADRYGPKHPQMISALAELDTANRNVHIQIKNVVDSVQKEYSVARAKESQLNSALNSTKQEVSNINRTSHKLKALEHEIESNRQLYDMFLTRFKETTATSDLQSANARIVDLAVIPMFPYKPKKQRIILIAIFLALIISIGLAFLIETLDNTLKDMEDVEARLMLPVLGLLPKLNIWFNKDVKSMRYFTDKKHSNFSENIRTIRTSVMLSKIDEEKKVVLVTSSVQGEGKSLVAINLALSMGEMGKVLLIGADMRKPTIGKVFGVNRQDPGLSDFIVGASDLKQCIHYFKEEKLYVMHSGRIPPNPLELLSSERFKRCLESLHNSFDYIVIDSAPTVPVSDSAILSKSMNIIVYVVKADETPYQLARSGLKKLAQVDANVIGVVLNMVNPVKRPGRYGYVKSDYYYYYGYSKKKSIPFMS